MIYMNENPQSPTKTNESYEAVNHPKHYSKGKYECLEVMKDVFGKEEVKTFCKLNAFKYLWRANNKNKDEDLKKAAFYTNYIKDNFMEE